MRHVHLRVFDGPRTGEGHAALDLDARSAVVLLPGLATVRRTVPDVLPEWIAACVGLGPRPLPVGTRILARSELPPPQAHWTLWSDRACLEVYDAGDGGLWAIAPADPALLAAEGAAAGLVTATSTTATTVWCALSTVLFA